MTDKEIVKSLRICATHIEKGCGLCPQMKYVRCTERLADEAITMIERLTAENAALREKQRWIPVTERPPEKQAWYHVAIRDKKTMRIAVEQDLYAVETAKNFGHEIGFCKANRWPEREELIAWMQFPSAPEAPEEGEKHE